MDEQRHDDEEQNRVIAFRHPARERRRLTIFLVFLAVLALAIGFFFVDGGRNWDRIQRFFTYGGKETVTSFDSAGAKALAVFRGGLAVADQDGLTVYDQNGREEFLAAMSLSSPAVCAAEDYILGYDVGGTALALVNKSGRAVLQDAAEGRLLDADLAPDGYLCFTSAGSSAKSVLSVYSKNQRNSFTVYSASRYLSACAVAQGGKMVCAVALGQKDNVFESTAVLYRTDTEEPVAEVSLGNQLIYDLRFWGSGTVCAVGEERLVVFTTKGKVLGEYACAGLAAYSLQGDGFAALQLPSAQGGSGWDLVTVGEKGQELGRVSVAEAGMHLSAQGKYLALLTASGLSIYSRTLQLWASSPDAAGADGVLMCADGSALLVEGQTARRYLP